MDDFIDAPTIKVEGKKRDMGLGQLGRSDITFVRQFRWTLEATKLSPHFMKSVSFDFKNQEVAFECYEVCDPKLDDIEILTWLENDMTHEAMTFTTYNGCGEALYTYQLEGLELLNDTASFDYNSSEAAIRSVVIKYNAMQRSILWKENPIVTVPKKGFSWFISVDNDKKSYPIKMQNRPSLSMEETPISFLNAKTWVPGKATWESVKVTLSKEAEQYLLPKLVNWRSNEIHLHLHPRFGDTGKRLETWTLENPWVINLDPVGLNYEIEFKFTGLKYNNEMESKHEERKSKD